MKRFTCPVAVHIFLMRGNQLFLQLRNHTSSFAHEHYVLAGHIDGNETLIQTAIREAKEEIGIQINPDDLEFATFCHSNTDNHEYIQVYFWCRKWTGTIQNNEPDKCSSFGFYDLDHLPDTLVPQLKVALKNALNKIPYYENGWN